MEIKCTVYYNYIHVASLKQTLQYGNSDDCFKKYVTYMSLKQTLQYGNVNVLILSDFNANSLKQTLQYGNTVNGKVDTKTKNV